MALFFEFQQFENMSRSRDSEIHKWAWGTPFKIYHQHYLLVI
jgi:hypothetical protein